MHRRALVNLILFYHCVGGWLVRGLGLAGVGADRRLMCRLSLSHHM